MFVYVCMCVCMCMYVCWCVCIYVLGCIYVCVYVFDAFMYVYMLIYKSFIYIFLGRAKLDTTSNDRSGKIRQSDSVVFFWLGKIRQPPLEVTII